MQLPLQEHDRIKNEFSVEDGLRILSAQPDREGEIAWSSPIFVAVKPR